MALLVYEVLEDGEGPWVVGDRLYVDPTHYTTPIAHRGEKGLAVYGWWTYYLLARDSLAGRLSFYDASSEVRRACRGILSEPLGRVPPGLRRPLRLERGRESDVA